MIMQQSPHMPLIGKFFLTSKLAVEVVDRITAKDTVFPHNYDPVGAIEQGSISTRGAAGLLWEKFVVRDGAIDVPLPLTNLARACFPGCRWDFQGGFLYAVKDRSVVAYINDRPFPGSW